MEKNMEHEMETREYMGLYRGYRDNGKENGNLRFRLPDYADGPRWNRPEFSIVRGDKAVDARKSCALNVGVLGAQCTKVMQDL